MDRTLSLEFARVVEAAALRSGRLLGRGQKDAADGLAVDAMRDVYKRQVQWSTKELMKQMVFLIAFSS